MAEEEKNFVSFGSALEPFEEDDVPKKKPIRLEDQIVTDEKGRRRFHGAFTGGFSAGYFNSVGSERGWTPSTFISSRSTRTVYADQCPEDYMDSEDVGAFGIAPRKIHTTKNFTAPEHAASKRKRPAQQRNETLIPGDYPLKELVVPLNNSIGVKLLRQMGWRQGEGIGPKVKRKKEKKTTTQDPGVKVYGCAMPPTSDGESDEEMSKYMFAPKDIDVIQYTAKENVFGLGYQGLDKRPVLSSTFSLFTNTPGVSKPKKRVGMQGQAFGVGAFEDDDDDIYALEDMSNYNFVLDGGPSKETKKKEAATKNEAEKILDGFRTATKPAANKKHFPLPSLPKNFKPFHVCGPAASPVVVPENNKAPAEDNKGPGRQKMTSFERGAKLGEEIQPGSVFNFISPHDKARLDSIRASIQKGDAPEIVEKNEEKPVEDEKKKAVLNEKINKLLGNQVRNANNEFKPFAGDEAKQNRYENFLSSKQGVNDVQTSNMTEWEKVREAEEFQKASQLYRPLAAGIASRFVAGKSLELEEEGGLKTTLQETIKEESSSTALVKAPEKRSFGRSTHTRVTWYPDKILCRRFNIPNPYPDSSYVGVPKAKREKFSIFNFLTSDNQLESVPVEGGILEMPTAKNKPDEDMEASSSAAVRRRESNDDDSDKEEERPPMDLFKAIFQDSDEAQSAESENDEDDGGDAPAKSPPIVDSNVGEKAEADISDRMEFGVQMRNAAVVDIEAESKRVQETPVMKQIVAVPEAIPVLEEYYGPKLPPSFTPSIVIKSEPTPVKKSKTKRKHKHKKHKKQKKRCKHKHTEKSSDESDSESSADETNPKEILQRLKKLQKSALSF